MFRVAAAFRGKALVLLLLCSPFLAQRALFSQGVNPITNCSSVLKLSPTEANQNRPVRLRGAVTCYIPASQLCFIQDETAGVYVSPSPWPKELSFGEIVEVQGSTGSGRFSPIVQWATFQRTGKRGNVTPKRISIEELNTGRFDCQLVQIEGVVQSSSFTDSLLTFQLWTGGSSATVLAFGFDREPTNLVDTTVRVKGVAGTLYKDSHLTGFALFLSTPEHLQVRSSGVDSLPRPLRPIRNLVWFSPDGALDHRIRIEGTVTVSWPGEAFFLQDQTGAIHLSPAPNAGEAVHPGDLVEAAGFVRDLTTNPRLQNALSQKKGSKPVPDPLPLAVKELLSKSPSGQYVSTEGTLENVRGAEKDLLLLRIESANELLTAVVKTNGWPELHRGSRVRVTGAWSIPPSELREQTGPVLWLNSSAAVIVLAAPKPSAPAAPARSSVLWIGITICAFLIAGLTIWHARRTGTRISALKEAEANRVADVERELQRLDESRERLGRDLHDRIIQSIYALGLNIDDCAQAVMAEPGKIQARLRAARMDVNAVIGELRSVVLGLETNAIQPREFRTALKSLALALGHDQSNRIRLSIDDDALAALTPVQATELVHIAREAMSNSIRHGSAQTTTFNLEVRDERIKFGVEDDGRGFDVKSAEAKGFGLRNMAKRAENLGANFSISSEEGHGTRILLDIPRQKQHFSTNESRPRIDR